MNSVIVHQFRIADSDDPELYAAEPLIQWEKSEQGQWIMKNAMETPTWITVLDPNMHCYQCIIKAKFTPEMYTFWKLKYG